MTKKRRVCNGLVQFYAYTDDRGVRIVGDDYLDRGVGWASFERASRSWTPEEVRIVKRWRRLYELTCDEGGE